MKSSFFYLSILSVTAAGLVNAQAAKAEPQEGGARWHFAPNVYRMEQPRMPAGFNAPTVKSGAVPSNLLGLDPALISKPAAPRIAARPNMMPVAQVSNKLFVPNTAFKPAFGQPVQPQKAEPIKMATLPPGAGSPISQMSAPPVAHHASVPVHSARPSHSHANVNGKLMTRIPHGQHATPAVAAYNTGYVPGGSLPAQSGAGSRTTADVKGRIVGH